MQDTATKADLILFETPDLLVRHVSANGGQICVVSFSSLTDMPCLQRSGFGEAFLRDGGYNAIHVINRTNIWYQYPEMAEALRAIRDHASQYESVYTYGSSMGGYAAIRFAETIGATTAIAISPQFSANPNVVGFDKRWRSLARRIDFSREERDPHSLNVEPVIFYDPNDMDARHFELIRQAFPKTMGVRIRHAGHPAGAFLAETGLLGVAVRDVLARRFEPLAFEKEARARRHESGQYFFTLARRQPPWRSGAKLGLATRAVERTNDAAYLIYLSLLKEREGHVLAAEQLLRRANEILPDHATVIRALGVFLLRHNRLPEALLMTRGLLAVDSTNRDFLRLAAMALSDTQSRGRWWSRWRDARYVALEEQIRVSDDWRSRSPRTSASRRWLRFLRNSLKARHKSQ